MTPTKTSSTPLLSTPGMEPLRLALEATSLSGVKTQADALDWSTCPNPQHTLKALPCAHGDPSKGVVCTKPGSKSCARCKLVSYCSKVSLPVPSGGWIALPRLLGMPNNALEVPQARYTGTLTPAPRHTLTLAQNATDMCDQANGKRYGPRKTGDPVTRLEARPTRAFTLVNTHCA